MVGLSDVVGRSNVITLIMSSCVGKDDWIILECCGFGKHSFQSTHAVLSVIPATRQFRTLSGFSGGSFGTQKCQGCQLPINLMPVYEFQSWKSIILSESPLLCLHNVECVIIHSGRQYFCTRHWSIQKVLCKCALVRAVYTPWWEVRWVATFCWRCMSDGIKMAWGSSRAGYFRQSVMSPKTKILSESRTMVAYTQVWILLCVFHFLYIFIILSKQFYHSLCTFSAFSRVVLGIERNEPHFNPFSWLC